MKVLFRGGTVVSGESCRQLDVLIDGEKILQVGSSLSCPDADIVNVEGKLLFPGFIDAHTHFDLDVCGTTTIDDFASGTAAALRGGTTTVIDFACPNKGESLTYGLNLWRNKAEGVSHCDYGFHMTIDDWNPEIRRELPEMLREGIPSFKMYMTYPAMMIGDQAIEEALKELKQLGAVAGVHCEDAPAIDRMIEEAKQAGKLGPDSHPKTRPGWVEAAAVRRLLLLTSAADAPVIIVHLSSREALEEVRRGRKNGQTVYVETCPHYLLLDESLYEQTPYIEGAKYVCAPPLRTKEDREALWQALAAGEIQTVATDHCSFSLAQKEMGRGDFTKIPGGLPSVETRGILLWSEGVAAGRISAETMCRVLSETPAKLYGAYPQKGALLPGSDADIVVLDPAGSGTLTAEDQLSKSDYCPYEGWETRGAIEQVWLRGRLAVSEGRLLTKPLGQYVYRTNAREK